VESLLQDGVGEEVVGLEFEAEGDGARVAVFAAVEFGAGHGDGFQRLGEDLGVLGLDELVDLGRAGLEHDAPEVGDVGCDGGALFVGGLGELVLLLDWEGRSQFLASGDGENGRNILIWVSMSSNSSSIAASCS
jgi:hypothetical protein